MCVTLSANKWASALHQDMAGVAIYANVAAAQAGCHTLARLAAGAAISLPIAANTTTYHLDGSHSLMLKKPQPANRLWLCPMDPKVNSLC